MKFSPSIKARKLSTLLLASALLAACAGSAPPPALPDAPLPTQWKSAAPAGWVSTADYRHWQDGQWWRLWDDGALDALVAELDGGNPNIALAAANVAQAQALLRQSQAQRLPTLGLQAGVQRSGEPARGSASLGLAASWAPDLWGRLAAGIEAQQAQLQASEADLAGARLAARASLVQAYLQVRELDAEMRLMDEIISGYERAEQITGNRYRAGVAAHTDLLQAQTTLENARATRVSLARSRATAEHAIALLLGLAPAQFTLAPAEWRAAAPQVPPLLPSELLLRRPDVASSERALAAANARIGAARAAWFPSLSLSAGLGAAGASIADLFSVPALTWSLGTAIAQTLLDGGSRDAALQQAIAQQQAAGARYRQSVLGALGEVEDQLTALDALARQAAHQRAAADAAAAAEQRTLNSYEAGLAAYTSVVSAQAATLGARRALMQLQLQRQQAVLALVQALGGGWQAPWSVDGAVGAQPAGAPAAQGLPRAGPPGR
ncbi:efflux transporter outer membrane subunit [Comamonas sp. NLF-1-9]|uniref:efflux transporter outer membrane subunit n=1 Tax=Comamonas sp. NLF-1-9 TaxID=2853163 RepID=UPI0021030080|nr:efflux transporter outer membrane subunit [Comamonas sp. NLF-1-9]